MRIDPNDAPLGAVVTGIDLARPLSEAEMKAIEGALGEHGVLCFPDQHLNDADHVAFTSRLGPLECNVASSGMTGDLPEVMVLSNIVRDGKPIGLADAGQDWHTDMSYSRVPGHATALHALEIPQENGVSLGDTEFCSMYRAYEGLPADVRALIDGRHAVRDFAKFWNVMIREKGSTRPPLTVEQRRRKPPVLHPLVIRHPISGRKALYADPGYTVSVVGLPRKESEDLLDFLFAHQVKADYLYRHRWRRHDFLIWDNLASVHRATGGYRDDQPRLMHRTQVVLDVKTRPGFAYTDNNAIEL